MAKKTTFSINAALRFNVFDITTYIWRGLSMAEALEPREVRKLSLLLLARPTAQAHISGELYDRLFAIAIEKEVLVADVARAAFALGYGVERTVEALRRARAAPPRVPRRLEDVEHEVLEMLGVI